MAETTGPKTVWLAVLTGLAGAVIAAVVGVLTFGVQATADRNDVPLAITLTGDAPQLRAAVDRITRRSVDLVSWRVTTPDEARKMLEDKEIYGYLELTPGDPPTAVITVSSAVNAQATEAARRILDARARDLTRSSVMNHDLYLAGFAGLVAPLAATALLWMSGMAGALLFGLLTLRRGVRAGPLGRGVLLATGSVAGVAVVACLFDWWGVSLNAEALGFLLLTAVAFAAVQGALVRLLGIGAGAILGLLYLTAPAVAGTAPELLDPGYRAALWSWTPFRFPTEGLSSLLIGNPSAPDVRTGVLVLSGMAVVGLVVLLWPGRSSTGQQAQPDPADQVVSVGVDQAAGLPGAEREAAV